MRIRYLLALALLIVSGVTTQAQERAGRVNPALIPLPAPFQFVDRILRPCSSGATPFVSAIAASDGDFDITTCAGRSVTINGTIITPSSLGNVIGPGSSTNNAIVRWNGTTGTLIKNSVFILDNSGNATTPGSITTGNAGGVTGSVALSGATSGTVTVTTKAAAGTWTFTLPDTDGNSGEFLQTNGSGVTAWAAATGTTINATNNVIPKRLNAGAFTDSRITDDGTTITADTGAGNFVAGDDTAAGNGTLITLNDSLKLIRITADDVHTGTSLSLDGSTTRAFLADGAGHGTLTLDGVTQQQTLGNSNSFIRLDKDTAPQMILSSPNIVTSGAGSFQPDTTGTTDLGGTNGWKQLFIDSTITAGGTTGAQTINKSAGSVNFAAAATSLVVTSNKVTTSSIVMCTVATNDTTLKSVQCVAAAGSFTMFANAAATAETRVNFWILNQ